VATNAEERRVVTPVQQLTPASKRPVVDLISGPKRRDLASPVTRSVPTGKVLSNVSIQPSRSQPTEPRKPAVTKPDDKIAPRLAKPAGPAPRPLLLIPLPVTVRDLSALLGVKPFALLKEMMVECGVFATVNETVDERLAERVCWKRGFKVDFERERNT
jgi:hypothetical protein